MQPQDDASLRRFEATLARMGAYFMDTSPLQKAAADISQRLTEMGIDYAIAGALCLAAHGVVRATEDVDVLITREGLERFKQTWLGRGYVNLRPDGKAVRDTVNDVKIDFLIVGDYPGDGRPKPVTFPSPRDVRITAGRFQVVAMPPFIEMKLASGMTAPNRLQDLADVLKLITVAKLPRAFGQTIDPYVQVNFDEFWQTAQHPEDDY